MPDKKSLVRHYMGYTITDKAGAYYVSKLRRKFRTVGAAKDAIRMAISYPKKARWDQK